MNKPAEATGLFWVTIQIWLRGHATTGTDTRFRLRFDERYVLSRIAVQAIDF
jgi:hypothetical protein